MKLPSCFFFIFIQEVIIIGQTVFGHIVVENDLFLRLTLTREDHRIDEVGRDTPQAQKFFLDDSHNVHVSPLGMGSSKQDIVMQYSTLDDFSWIIMMNQYDSCDPNRNNTMSQIRKIYNGDLSTNHWMMGDYGAALQVQSLHAKRWVFGYKGGDSVRLEGPHTSHGDWLSLRFIHVIRASSKIIYGKPDGVVSLRYDPKNPDGSYVVRECNLVVKKDAVFAFWYPKKQIGVSDSTGGELYMCALDTTKFVPNTLQYTDELHPGDFRVRLDEINIIIGNTTATLYKNPVVNFDSTSEIIYVWPDHWSVIGRFSLAYKINDPRIYEKNLVQCDKITELPTFHFHILGSIYSLTPEDYITQLQYNGTIICEMLIRPAANVGDRWTLGDIFFRKVYTVFHITSRKVGFAKIKN